MAELGSSLKNWVKRFFEPDEQQESEQISEEASKILEEGTKKAGEGIFEEVKGYTPDDNTAIVFVDPKTLGGDEGEEPRTPSKDQRKMNKPDDETFERLEREEEDLDSKAREARRVK